MSFALSSGAGWPSAYLVIGAIQIALTFALLVSIPLWRRVHPLVPASVGEGGADAGASAAGAHTAHVPLARALRIPGVMVQLNAIAARAMLAPVPTGVARTSARARPPEPPAQPSASLRHSIG